MHILISTFLKQASIFLNAFSTKVEEIPEILQLLADFLKKEPLKNFTYHFGDLKVPFTLIPGPGSSEEHFKTFTEKFPSIYKSGLFPEKEKAPINLIYVIGQVLTNIAIVLEYLNMGTESKELKSQINSVYEIWGSMRHMNARKLVDKYKNESAEHVKTDLISNLEASAKIIKKFPPLE